MTKRKRDWPVAPAERVRGWRLEAALAHSEVEVAELAEDEQRPRFRCRELHVATHAPFWASTAPRPPASSSRSWSRRLHMLPREKVEREMAYLEIAIGKTAGDGRAGSVGVAGGSGRGAPGCLRRPRLSNRRGPASG